MKTTTRTTLLLLAMATTVGAQNADAETRYHEAYVLEVVDGKVADAARRYLELLREPGLPAHLTAQCRFRFAVTCALLGRADEARARLAALAADPETPKALQPQVEEYRKALRDVGPGRALDDKFDELKMKLAQAHPGNMQTASQAQRAWAAIGKPAVPYLERLLEHPDQQLRVHAFTILCQFDVPGLAGKWDPRLPWIERELEAYLKRNPSEVPVLERRLAEFPDPSLGHWLGQLRTVSFSRGFIEKLETRAVAPRLVPMVGHLGVDTAREFLAHWIRKGSPELARAAAQQYVANPSFPAAGLLGPICLRLAPENPSPAISKRIFEMARQVDPAERMRVLGELVAAGEKDPAVLTNGVADLVASNIDGDEFDAGAYQQLLRRWLAVLKEHPKHENHFLARHLRAALRKLPGPEATAWMREIVRQDVRHGDPLEYHDVFEVPLVWAALEATSGDARRAIGENLVAGLAGATPFYLRNVAPAYPRAIAFFRPKEMGNALWAFRFVATEIPDPAPAAGRFGTAARAVALELVDVVLKAGLTDAAAAEAVAALFASERDRERGLESRYLRNVAIPLLGPLTERLGTAAARRAFAAKAYDLLVDDAQGGWDLKEARDTLRAYVADSLPHLDEWHDFERVEPPLPPAKWMPYASADAFNALSKDRRAAAARAFAREPGPVTKELMDTLSGLVSVEVGSEVVDALLARADARQLGVILGGMRDWRWGRPETLEAILVRGQADSDYSLADLARVGEMLAQIRPTRKLYPLVERLLASNEPEFAMRGVAMAASLGQPDLLPALAKLLDSLDPDVRTAAQNAMTTIAWLEELRREARAELGSDK